MKILTLTDKFPNSAQPGRSPASKYRANFLRTHCEVKVVAPVPFFPSLRIFKKWHEFSQVPYREYIDSIEIMHPRYPYLPVISRPIHGILYFASILPFLMKLKKEYDFDLIDAIWVYPDGYAAVLAGRYLNVPVTIRTIGSDIHEYRNYPLIRQFVKYALMKCDRIFSVCKALKTMMNDMGIPPEKIRVLYNGIDLSLFYPSMPPRKKISLVYVGSLSPIKGLTYLIDAFALLCSRNKELELAIIGTGKLWTQLNKQIESLGLSNKVTMLGQLSHEEVAQYIRMSNLLILPSKNEGLPNVIVEALSCHVPVVASDIGGIPEAAAYGKYGILVKPCESVALAEGIEKALKTKWDFSDVDQHLRQFSWESNIRQTLQEFRLLIDKKTNKVF